MLHGRQSGVIEVGPMSDGTEPTESRFLKVDPEPVVERTVPAVCWVINGAGATDSIRVFETVETADTHHRQYVDAIETGMATSFDWRPAEMDSEIEVGTTIAVAEIISVAGVEAVGTMDWDDHSMEVGIEVTATITPIEGITVRTAPFTTVGTITTRGTDTDTESDTDMHRYTIRFPIIIALFKLTFTTRKLFRAAP